jgi:hypothetical protein
MPSALGCRFPVPSVHAERPTPPIAGQWTPEKFQSLRMAFRRFGMITAKFHGNIRAKFAFGKDNTFQFILNNRRSEHVFQTVVNLQLLVKGNPNYFNYIYIYYIH